MIVNVIRTVFFILVGIVASAYLARSLNGQQHLGWGPYLIMLGGVVLAFAVITIDVLVRKKNLSALAGLFFGLLVGILISLALAYLADQITGVFLESSTRLAYQPVIMGGKLLLGLCACYLSVSLILQTKDDFRFIIPYVEFSRATRGPKPYILDTSVIIDGRIAEVAATGIFESRLVVPRFVINELQAVADSSDRLKRSRGRRGLEVLKKLQEMPRVELHIWDGVLAHNDKFEGVDQKLVGLAQQETARIITNDYNLNKVAGLHGVAVVNINDLANAVKSTVLPGEKMRIRIVKPGEASGQGVGYLDDGTMVVVEGSRDKIGSDVEVLVTNAVQTSAGRMIFGRCNGTPERAIES